MASLLMDCQVCFDKGHESWTNYFSKWEQLAKHEEHIPESELIDDWNDNLKPKKKKKQPSLLKKTETGSSLTKKKIQKEKKNSKKLNKKKKISRKPNQVTKAEVSEQPKSSGNEILPEQLDNKQLEMNLKAVLMNILEANKNKWEVFSILSQTFSQGRSAIKGSQPPLQNQHLGLTSNDLKLDHMSFSFKNQQFVSVPIPRVRLTVEPVFELDKSIIDCQRFWSNSVCRNLNNSSCLLPSRNNVLPKVNFDGNVFNRFKYSYTNTEHLFWSNNMLTPKQNAKLGSGMESRLVRSCPTSFSNYTAYRRNPPIRPRALEFGTKFPSLEYDKKSSDESIRKENCGRPHTDRGPEGSSSRKEKRFQSLCSHKRTNDVCLNKENSNFITPERKSSKRKCFSENILQRKRRRSSKLFFDNEDEDSESDDQTGKSSPLIRWENKKQKSLLTPEAVVAESDSDECESIFDRVKKP